MCLHQSFHFILVEQDVDMFSSSSIEAGDELAGIITLRAPLNGIARHDIMVRRYEN